jgi:biopolymer transport protein TolR
MIRNTTRATGKNLDSINLTPMTDVMLTLLVLFLVMETAGATMAINMNIPNVKAVETPKDPTLLISVLKDGNVVISTKDQGENRMPREQILGYLGQMRKQRGYEAVIIQANSDVQYREIIEIIDEAKQAGFDKIMLPTEKE